MLSQLTQFLSASLPCMACHNQTSFTHGFCQDCTSLIEHAPKQNTVTACWLYQGPIQQAIINWKEHGQKRCGQQLITAYIENIKQQSLLFDGLKAFDAIVIIPPCIHRMIQRGFHPPDHIGQSFSRFLSLPIYYRLLWRKTSTRLMNLTRQKRLEIAPYLFSPFWRPSRIKDKKILLIDDVMTTGTTLNAAHNLLVNAGAQSVHYLVLARVPIHLKDT